MELSASLCNQNPPPPLKAAILSNPPTKTTFLSNPLTKTVSFTPKTAFRKAHKTAIRSAISRTKKEETVETVRQQLEDCYLVAGIKYKGLTVKQFQDLRSLLPESVKLIVAKNTLVGKAIENTQWEALKPCMKGMNAWLFVHTEEITGALKPYRNFQREQKLDDNDYTGAVFEGRFYGPDEFKALETMPTKAEIFSKLLGLVQGPSISLIGTLQAPARDIVGVLKAYVKKMEDEGK
ncbi:hypothetical protein AMTRI_Chr08g165360 [Amborella trichopoda]